MMINWITLLLVMVFLWSVYHGFRRGFAYESGHLAAQCMNIVAGIVAIWIGWVLSNFVSRWAGSAHPGHWPHWAAQIVQAWQQSPNVARMVTFAGFYLLSSSVLHAFTRPFPAYVSRVIPKRIGSNRYLGGAMGALIGLARALTVGGLIFLVTQYFSFPGLVREAGQSSVYKMLSERIYRPWLKPFVVRELPVLAQGALQPLANNINLFAIPTPVQGQQRGVLVVPKDISQLAQSIVQGSSSSRQKAHALYEWESHHIKYDWNKYNDYVYHNKWDNQSPEQTLHTGKGVCADYALLYADMAHSVGLTVQIDEGIGGTASQNGPHAWNKVLDGSTQHWIPVDTTWGSEEDVWFDPEGFDQTHKATNDILIESSNS
jgi:transglutaminase-like putative cysteine protease